MKKFLSFAMFAVLSASSYATEVKIYEYRDVGYFGEEFTSGDFAINRSLGRAWVVLSFNANDPESVGSEVRAQIAGMSFDPSTKEVIIDSEAGRVICAREKRFLGIRSIKATGECKFKTRTTTVRVDNGYEIETYQKNTVYLVY